MSIGVQHHRETVIDRYRSVFLAAFGISLVLNLLLLIQLFWRTQAGGLVFHFNGPLFSIGILVILAVVAGRWIYLRRRTSETLSQIGAAQAEGRALESKESPTPRPPIS